MLKKILNLTVVLFLITSFSFAEEKAPEESDQQISDFSLAGYGEKGEKAWDLSGKSADIFDEVIKLKDVVGNMYDKKEDMNLTADRGDFNKEDGSVHLEENVVITTSSGAKLTTDSLDWDRNEEIISTKDLVNIERNNLVAVAQGAKGEPSLNTMALEREVRVDINSIKKDREQSTVTKEKTTITCDGPLEIDYEKNIAVFNNNVKVDRPDTILYSDKMDVYFSQTSEDSDEPEEADGPAGSDEMMGSSIDKIIAQGNVKIVRGENISYSDKATYLATDKRIILNGRPKLVIYSTEDLSDASLGD